MRIKPNRFEEKIDRLRQYRDAGRRSEVVQVFRDFGVTERTLDEWLAAPNPNARYVRNGIFDKILQRLPDLKIAEHVRSYRLGLRERGLDEESQLGIRKYVGAYNIYTNIDSSNIEFVLLRILFSEDIYFPVFKLRAILIDQITGKPVPRVCDGYIILDGQRLVFTGLGEYFSTFIIARAAINVSQDPMRCVVTIEDRYSGYSYTSPGALKISTNKEPLPEDFLERLHFRV